MGERPGVVRFLGWPEEMKAESGSHARSSNWALDWAPQSMRKPLGGVWVWERGRDRKRKRKRRGKRRERAMEVVSG